MSKLVTAVSSSPASTKIQIVSLTRWRHKCKITSPKVITRVVIVEMNKIHHKIASRK